MTNTLSHSPSHLLLLSIYCDMKSSEFRKTLSYEIWPVQEQLLVKVATRNIVISVQTSIIEHELHFVNVNIVPFHCVSIA